MNVIKDTIGSTDIYIQTFDDTLDIVGEPQSGRATQLTGIDNIFTHAYTKLKTVLRGIAEDVSTEVRSIDVNKRPKELEMDFNLGLSAQAGIWVLGAKGDYALHVRMVWEFEGR